jgi:hypothetical protein
MARVADDAQAVDELEQRPDRKSRPREVVASELEPDHSL